MLGLGGTEPFTLWPGPGPCLALVGQGHLHCGLGQVHAWLGWERALHYGLGHAHAWLGWDRAIYTVAWARPMLGLGGAGPFTLWPGPGPCSAWVGQGHLQYGLGQAHAWLGRGHLHLWHEPDLNQKFEIPESEVLNYHHRKCDICLIFRPQLCVPDDGRCTVQSKPSSGQLWSQAKRGSNPSWVGKVLMQYPTLSLIPAWKCLTCLTDPDVSVKCLTTDSPWHGPGASWSLDGQVHPHATSPTSESPWRSAHAKRGI